MSYAVVYDASQGGPDLVFPAIGVLFVVISSVIYRYRDRMPDHWRGPRTAIGRKRFAAVFLGFAVIWTVLATTVTLVTWRRDRRAVASGALPVVEGPVEDFHPMPYGGHDTERFRVGDVHFAYSDYVYGQGFNHTSSHGGPIHEGLHVRIHYGGTPSHASILELEVEEPAP